MSSPLNELRALVPGHLRYFFDMYIENSAIDEFELSNTKLSEFARLVLSEIKGLSPGETITYKELANRIGRPKAIRAVASALGRNPFPFVYPCHRVIASDGTLGGYAWGKELKAALLNYEGVIL